MFILGFAVLFTAAAGAAAYNARKRREALERLAGERCWGFVRDGGQYAGALSHFPLFSKGRRRRASNVLHGGEGEAEFWAFDYQYTIGSGKHSHTHRQTVFVFPRLSADLPPFEPRPEHIFHKIGAAFGYQDINLTQYPAFSSRFLLRGPDASAIRELFDDELVRALEIEKTRTIEGAGSALIVYRDREKVNTHRIPEAMEHADRVRHVFAQRAARGSSMSSVAASAPLSV